MSDAAAGARPGADAPAPAPPSPPSSPTAASPPLLHTHALSRRYRLPRASLFAPAASVQALHGVGFTLHAGRSLGVVGESGSGKSTLARLVLALEAPDEGTVAFEGADLHRLDARALRRARAGFQMVFQDPFGSLDPRRTVLQTVAEPLALLRGTAAPLSAFDERERAAAALAEVGLGPGDLAKYPHEFSGGQRQRIAIARALITRPKLIVADEPVSALDVSVQAQVLNLLRDLRERHGTSYLFISHDLAVVDTVCDDVIVLRQGRVVEAGPTARVFASPQDPYTRRLLDAVPGARPLGAARRAAGRTVVWPPGTAR